MIIKNFEEGIGAIKAAFEGIHLLLNVSKTKHEIFTLLNIKVIHLRLIVHAGLLNN